MKIKKKNLPKHIGIIMDGNGRWATRRRLPRLVGHREGIRAIKRIVEAAISLKIEILTFFAFSTENWKRDKQEIDGIFNIIKEYIDNELDDFMQKDLKVETMGDISALPPKIYLKLLEVKEQTKNNTGLIVNLGINYGARDEIVRAFNLLAESGENASIENIRKNLYSAQLPDPDLIIRTSGEKRLSNFMLFQCAYSELYFTKTFWPSFNKKHLSRAIKNFGRRERRFGGNHK